jgi:hypothetical protein
LGKSAFAQQNKLQQESYCLAKQIAFILSIHSMDAFFGDIAEGIFRGCACTLRR